MATWVAGMGFSQAHRNRSTLDDVPDLVRVLVLKGLIISKRSKLEMLRVFADIPPCVQGRQI